jgi:rhodanese-related sulfurtransferase
MRQTPDNNLSPEASGRYTLAIVIRVIVRSVIILAWSVGTALVWNAARSEGIPLSQGGILNIIAQREGFAFIILPEAKTKYDNGAIFIDARPREEQEAEGTIFGAYPLPAPSFEEWYPEIEMQVPHIGMDHVVFCSGETCTDSIDVAKKLRARGWEQVFVMEEGFQDWAAAGYDVQQDPMPKMFGDEFDMGGEFETDDGFESPEEGEGL